jgi:hypothetical protein
MQLAMTAKSQWMSPLIATALTEKSVIILSRLFRKKNKFTKSSNSLLTMIILGLATQPQPRLSPELQVQQFLLGNWTKKVQVSTAHQ